MRSIFFFISVVFFCLSCNNSIDQQKQDVISKDTIQKAAIDTLATRDCAVLFKRAKQMDSTILTALEVNPVVANNTIRAFTDYAYYCESDSLSPIYLMKTAQVAMAINNPNQAKVVLDRCINNYPKFKNKPAAIFMLAQLYDEQHLLNNEEEAKKLYEKLVFEYSGTDWAKSAKAAIKLLGKSDEEIIRDFNKK